MKFDIVKFIDDTCQDYLQGCRTKKSVLNDIKLALKKDSWQNLCDGKEVVNDITGRVVEANDQVWAMHPSWCIEDKMVHKK